MIHSVLGGRISLFDPSSGLVRSYFEIYLTFECLFVVDMRIAMDAVRCI